MNWEFWIMRWNDHGDTFIEPRMTTLDSVMRYFLNTDSTDYTDKSLRLGDSCYLWDSCLFLFYWRASLLYPHNANPLHHHVPEWSSLYGIQDAFARDLAWGVRIQKRRESRSRSYSSAYHLSGIAWETGTSPKLPLASVSHFSMHFFILTTDSVWVE